MGWVADLLKEIPTAAKYRYELEKMLESEKELRKKNSDLCYQIEELKEEIMRLKPTAPSILKPDELQILKNIALSSSWPTVTTLTIELSLKPVHVEYLLGNLLEYQFIDAYPRPVFRDSVETVDVFSITQIGRKYLYENDEM